MYLDFYVPHRRWDFDNLMAALKWPLDFLKTRGMLVNDSAARLWPGRLPTQHLVAVKDAKLMLRLKPVSEDILARVVCGNLRNV
jgi:hypothetical protein